MSILKSAINPWGRSGSGAELQRADLWEIDFQIPFNFFTSNGIFGGGFYGIDIKYNAVSVSFPEVRTNPEVVRRDSRPYNFPGWDEAVGALRIVFRVDAGAAASSKTAGVREYAYSRSQLLKFLDTWRAVVRAGRGPMSNERHFVNNVAYGTPYAHDFGINLLRGASNPSLDDSSSGMSYSTKLTAKNAWLSSTQLSDLSYEKGNEIFTVSTVFFCDDILNANGTEGLQTYNELPSSSIAPY